MLIDDPKYVAHAYQSTQPQAIFREGGDEEEEEEEKAGWKPPWMKSKSGAK